MLPKTILHHRTSHYNTVLSFFSGVLKHFHLKLTKKALFGPKSGSMKVAIPTLRYAVLR